LDAAELNTDVNNSEPINENIPKSPEVKNITNKREYNIINHQREENGTDKHQEENIGTEVKSGSGKTKYNIITHTKSSESLLGKNDDISPKFSNGDGDDVFSGYKSQHNNNGYPGSKNINKSYEDPKYGNKFHDVNDKYGRKNYKPPPRVNFGDGNDEYGITSYDSKFEYVGSVPSFGPKDNKFEYGGPNFGAKDNFEFGGGPNFGAKRSSSPPHALLHE
jgi:hypothetical protein